MSLGAVSLVKRRVVPGPGKQQLLNDGISIFVSDAAIEIERRDTGTMAWVVKPKTTGRVWQTAFSGDGPPESCWQRTVF